MPYRKGYTLTPKDHCCASQNSTCCHLWTQQVCDCSLCSNTACTSLCLMCYKSHYKAAVQLYQIQRCDRPYSFDQYAMTSLRCCLQASCTCYLTRYQQCLTASQTTSRWAISLQPWDFTCCSCCKGWCLLCWAGTAIMAMMLMLAEQQAAVNPLLACQR